MRDRQTDRQFATHAGVCCGQWATYIRGSSQCEAWSTTYT